MTWLAGILAQEECSKGSEVRVNNDVLDVDYEGFAILL